MDDIPFRPGELHAAMIQAKQARCELDIVDPSAALVSYQWSLNGGIFNPPTKVNFLTLR